METKVRKIAKVLRERRTCWKRERLGALGFHWWFWVHWGRIISSQWPGRVWKGALLHLI